MCSIFGSYNKDKFFELAELNSHRGSHSYSISYYDPATRRLAIKQRDFGLMPDTELDDGYYYIGHVQAPTTEMTDETAIHPANDMGDYLWHNGIIKTDQVREWQLKWDKDWKWDTKWFLYLLNTGSSLEFMSETNGSFACIWYGKYNPYLRMFRNDNCPMFVCGTHFSSTKFDNSVSIKSGQVYEFEGGGWIPNDKLKFSTKETFFWSP